MAEISDKGRVELLADWVDSIREDVETIKKVVAAAEVGADARKFAATALNYLVTRMDLVPDWEPSIGVADDVMALRACVALAADHGVDSGLTGETSVAIGRLGNEAERIADVIGRDLYLKLKKHCARLAEQPVRGRTARAIVDDAEQRDALFRELEDELLRMPAASFSDPESLIRQLTSYLETKLD